MSDTNGTMDAREFAALAEAFGGDLSRWPASRRAAARDLAGRSAEARAHLAQASALDRLLGAADRAEAAPAHLVDRISAAALKSPRIVPLEKAPEAVAVAPVAPLTVSSRAGGARSGPRAEVWRSAALLAACMVVGVFVGGSRLSDSALPALEELTGLSLTSPVQGLVLAAGEVEED